MGAGNRYFCPYTVFVTVLIINRISDKKTADREDQDYRTI